MKYAHILLVHTVLLSSFITHASLSDTQAIVLAAGHGSRFKTGITKQIVSICGQPMIIYPLHILQRCNIPTTVVTGYQRELVEQAIENAHINSISYAIQEKQNGTGHALQCSQSFWSAENILVMNGDMPLITTDIIAQLCNQHQQHNAAISFVITKNTDPKLAFGRIVQNKDYIAIVEAKHFIGDINKHPYVNAGLYLIRRSFLENFLSTVEKNEQTSEFYITDLVHIASNNKLPVTTLEVPFDPVRGVNTLKELAIAEQLKQKEIIEYWMTQGVRFHLPDTIRVDVRVTIGVGTEIGAGVHLLGSTTIGKQCTIAPYTILMNAHILDNQIIT